jgi:hypothetical protein
MVKVIYVRKQFTDEKFDPIAPGRLFGTRHYREIITEDTDCYWIDENEKKHVLFKFRKRAIRLPEAMLKEIRDIYESFGKQGASTNASNDSFNFGDGTTKFVNKDGKEMKIYTRSARSKISGFYDRASVPDLIRKFHTTNVCRTTRFTRDHFDKWQTALPLFENIAKIYKRLAPKHYSRQMELFKTGPPGFQIGNTPFTTITSNYNWRTACHKDAGDFEGGMGNLTILGDDTFKGGYLGFPQFRVAVDVRPLDVIIMDVHQYHANTQLKADEKNVRLSFVCYYRINMQRCNRKAKWNGETYYYSSPRTA